MRWRRDFPPVQTGPGAHPASCTMGTGSFPGVKWPVCGAHHSFPSSAEVTERRAIPLLHLWAFVTYYGVTFTFTGHVLLLRCPSKHDVLGEGNTKLPLHLEDQVTIFIIKWSRNLRNTARKKVKVTLVQALRLCTGRTAHTGSRGIALPFHDHSSTRGARGQHHASAALYPRGKTRYQLYRRLGGTQGRSGRVRNISPPPRFDPRTIQPVASRYTD